MFSAGCILTYLTQAISTTQLCVNVYCKRNKTLYTFEFHLNLNRKLDDIWFDTLHYINLCYCSISIPGVISALAKGGEKHQHSSRQCVFLQHRDRPGPAIAPSPCRSRSFWRTCLLSRPRYLRKSQQRPRSYWDAAAADHQGPGPQTTP